MGVKKGERQAKRSREALKGAFKELLAAKSYGDISVGEIVERADIGRSTFYRHFKGKPDVLIAMHEEIFGALFSEMATQEDWLSGAPPASLIRFLVMYEKFFSSHNVSMGADIGIDADYIMREVTALFAVYLNKALAKAFAPQEPVIPLPVLASSIAGVYSMVIMAWRSTAKDQSSQQMATHIHKLTRALVREAFAFGD